MIVNDLTKALLYQWLEQFLRQIRLEDISEYLQQEKKMKTLQDWIKDSQD